LLTQVEPTLGLVFHELPSLPGLCLEPEIIAGGIVIELFARHTSVGCHSVRLP
jgi:hypothetical protein